MKGTPRFLVSGDGMLKTEPESGEPRTVKPGIRGVIVTPFKG